MSISLHELDARCVTLAAAASLEVGDLCKLSTNRTAAKTASGEVPFGPVVGLRGGAAVVQMGGYVTLPYSGTAPAVGYGLLAADGNGGMKTVESGGKHYFICEVDTTAKTVGLFL